jgi:hypothetical protein
MQLIFPTFFIILFNTFTENFINFINSKGCYYCFFNLLEVRETECPHGWSRERGGGQRMEWELGWFLRGDLYMGWGWWSQGQGRCQWLQARWSRRGRSAHGSQGRAQHEKKDERVWLSF